MLVRLRCPPLTPRCSTLPTTECCRAAAAGGGWWGHWGVLQSRVLRGAWHGLHEAEVCRRLCRWGAGTGQLRGTGSFCLPQPVDLRTAANPCGLAGCQPMWADWLPTHVSCLAASPCGLPGCQLQSRAAPHLCCSQVQQHQGVLHQGGALAGTHAGGQLQGSCICHVLAAAGGGGGGRQVQGGCAPLATAAEAEAVPPPSHRTVSSGCSKSSCGTKPMTLSSGTDDMDRPSYVTRPLPTH
jgi:hypothetical protein